MSGYGSDPRFLGGSYEGSKFPRKFDKIQKIVDRGTNRWPPAALRRSVLPTRRLQGRARSPQESAESRNLLENCWKDLLGPSRSYSKDPDNRPPLTNRPPLPDPTPMLIATFTVFTAIWTFSPRGPWGTPGGQSPPGTLGATGEGLDSCKDSESSC